MEITKSDLIGELKGFPIDIVNQMLKEQVEQGNKEDITVFQRRRDSDIRLNGFDWTESRDGYDFWRNILELRNFDVFYSKRKNILPSYSQNYVIGELIDSDICTISSQNNEGVFKYLTNILENGHKGFNNMTDEELKEKYLEYFGEMIEITD